jgi:hypothetical protein
LADRLPPHRPGIDHEVGLKDGEISTLGPLYSKSRAKLAVLKEWCEENMSKGFIRQLSSPFAASVLFAEKSDGGVLFCIDYWNIHSKTITNQYPFALIPEALNLLRRARLYTKLDLQGAYNLLCVKEGHEYKLAFRTRYGLFGPTLMQFGTTNAPADFQCYINNAIREALDDFVSPYLDDGLIHSDLEKEHVGYV